MTKFQNILAILSVSLYAACSTQPVEPQIGQPLCGSPIPVDAMVWNDLGLLREVISFNSLTDGECIERLRARIKLHDENIQ